MKKNRLVIALLIVFLVVMGCTNNGDYEKATELILNGEYSQAMDLTHERKTKEERALFEYACLCMKINNLSIDSGITEFDEIKESIDEVYEQREYYDDRLVSCLEDAYDVIVKMEQAMDLKKIEELFVEMKSVDELVSSILGGESFCVNELMTTAQGGLEAAQIFPAEYLKKAGKEMSEDDLEKISVIEDYCKEIINEVCPEILSSVDKYDVVVLDTGSVNGMIVELSYMAFHAKTLFFTYSHVENCIESVRLEELYTDMKDIFNIN